MQTHECPAQPRAHRRLLIALALVFLSSQTLRIELACELVGLVLEAPAESVDEHSDDGFDGGDDHLVEQEGDKGRRLRAVNVIE